MPNKYSVWLNALGLWAVCFALFFALADQFIYNEIPCPLCILQRAGLIAAGFGVALNLASGIRPSHYGLVILGALVGASVAVRQILLHIVPGTGGYGSPFINWHFYTWDFIISVLMILGSAAMLVFDCQINDRPCATKICRRTYLPLGFFALLAVANGISTLLECGGGLCPDNPTRYLLLP